MLVDSDETKWMKHLMREDWKLMTCAMCNKIKCGTMNNVFMAFKKLAGHLTDWDLVVIPYDPCA